MNARALLSACILLLLAIVPASAQQAEPFVDISVTPEEVAVGEPITLNVTVFVPTWFAKPPTFPSFEIPNAITRLPPDSTRPTSRRIGRDTWTGISRNYQVYPLMGARFRIGDQPIVVQYANPGGDPRNASIDTGDIDFTALVPAGAEGLNPYVAGTRLELTRSVEGDTEAVDSGDAIVVTYTAELEGLSAIFLPELVVPADVPGVSVYPEQPVVTDGDVAIRTEKLTYIFNAGGEFEIPAVSINWWNSEDSVVEMASVPALPLTVVGPMQETAPVEEPAEETNWWPVIAALALVALLFRRVRADVDRELVKYRERERIRLASEPYAWDQARKAIGSGDTHRAHDEIVRWLARLDHEVDSRQFAARYGDAELASELAVLNRSLYADGKDSADLGLIARGLSVARKRCLNEQQQQLDVALPPLNP